MRVETIVVSHHQWGEPLESLADDYDLPVEAVADALALYEAHRDEIDTLIRINKDIEARHGKSQASS